VTSTPIFTTADEAEAAFYGAFEALDADAMRTVWEKSLAVRCIHPGGEILQGIERVMASWQSIFSSGQALRFRLAGVVRWQDKELAVHTGIERISRGDDPRVVAEALFTNAYRRMKDGWKMILHHACVVERTQGEATEDEDGDETPPTLH
jgi:SnoaL-like domain